MRFSHFSVLALSGLSIASPVLLKRADAVSLLTDLYATIQVYTGAINATLAPLSVSSSAIDKTAATAQVGAQIDLITAAVTATTNDIKALPPASTTKRSIDSDTVVDTEVIGIESQPKEKRQLIAVGALLALIIVEIFATVTATVAILGLSGLLVFLNPLTASLSLLILTVELVLDVVLLDVIALLDSLLTALALGVSGL
ncbi:Nn.00g087090.m01.CDS01 [Neocucurbitaria sp. VM-36]